MVKIGKCCLFLTVLLFSLSAYAEITVSAKLSHEQVAVGESFVLTVTVDSDKSVRFNPPSLPVIPKVQSGRQWSSSSSRSSMVSTGQGVDFKTLRSKIYNYEFMATEEGRLVIEPISVTIAGKDYSTNSVALQVLPEGARSQMAQPKGQRPQRQRRKDPFAEMEDRFNALLNRQFGQLPGMGGFQTAPPLGKNAFFILAEVDKTEAYKGEQVLASWYLYTQGRVADIDTLKYPTLKGFWKEDIQISTMLNFEPEVINGVRYNRALLASYALFPIEPGKQTIDPYKAKATIVGGFSRRKQFTKSSKSIPILIKPLPEEGKPLSFTGAVGQFAMTVQPPRDTIITHQPFPLRIRFEGRGNAKLIELPELNLPEGVEIYDVKNESKFFKNGQSFKEFEVLLIPSEAGELSLPPLKFTYFDSKTGEYVESASQAMNLRVLPGAKQQSIGEERLKSDIKKKKLPAMVREWNPNFEARSPKNFLWLLMYGLVALLLVVKFVIDSGLLNRNPSLEEVIGQRFGRVDKLVSKNQVRKAGIEVTNTVYHVLGELSGEGGANQELDKILAKTAPSVRREIEEPLRKQMDYFGVLGFGPKSYVKDFKDTKGMKTRIVELKKLLLQACKLSKGISDEAES